MLQEKVIHELEIERSEIIRDWINRPVIGAAAMWNEAWRSLEGQAQARVKALITEAKAAGEMQFKIGREDIAKRLGVIERQIDTPQTLKDTIEVAVKAWPVAGGLGVGGVIASIVGSGLAFLGPVGWTVILTAGITGIFARWRTNQVREKRRQEMLLDLDRLAPDAISAYKVQARHVVSAYTGTLIKVIDDEIQTTTQTINTLDNRIKLPENVNRGNRLASIRGLLKKTDSIKQNITLFEKTFLQSRTAERGKR